MARYVVRPSSYLGVQAMSTPQLSAWLDDLTTEEKSEAGIVSVDSVSDGDSGVTVIVLTVDDGTGPIQNTYPVPHGSFIVLEGWVTLWSEREFWDRFKPAE